MLCGLRVKGKYPFILVFIFVTDIAIIGKGFRE